MRGTVAVIALLLCCGAVHAQPEPAAALVFEPADDPTDVLLREPVPEGQAIVWHLFHSGFALRTANHLLIFDYWPGPGRVVAEGGLAAGFVDPAELRGQDVLVFVSHEHDDHWYRDAIDWVGAVKKIHFVVSEGVARIDDRYAGPRVTVTGPDESFAVGDARVKTLLSTDAGVAFLVKVDGLTIYHSGDHAAWNWKKDPQAEQEYVTRQLQPLRGESIDIAMHVCDPRLAAGGWGGIIAFAEAFRPRLLVPMHLKGNYAALSRIAPAFHDDVVVPFWAISGRGEAIRYRK